MTSRIAEIINRYPPLAFTSHPALIAELEAYHAGLVGALEEAHSALGPTVRIHTAAARADALKEAEAIVRAVAIQTDPSGWYSNGFTDARNICADAIAALAKEPALDLTSPSQSAIIQGE